jgi:hypothetical protein
MTDELERTWMKTVMSKLGSYPDICMEGLRETMKTSIRIAYVPAEI